MKNFAGIQITFACFLLTAGLATAAAELDAKQILDASGVKGGLVVHLGCGDGKLTAAFHANDSFLVHGLDADAKNIAAAHQHIQSLGLCGKVSADQFDGKYLPYVDNLVNLIVVDKLGNVAMTEVMRVLAPNGVVMIGGKKTVKPWPKEIDEWTHALHGPDNNAVAHDSVVGPPQHLQWIGGPAWTRSHDHLASVSAVVSSAGRLFFIADEGPTASIALPSRWFLVARDAFSGVDLWRRPIETWENRLRGFRSGPVALSRRLVAIGDEVYVTLGYGKPLTALNAATGATLRTYAGTDDTLEIIHADGTLFLVLGSALSHAAESPVMQRGSVITTGQKRLLAINAATGAVLWQKSGADTAELMPTALAVAGGRVFFENPNELICLEAKSGCENWRAARPVSVNRWAWSAPTLVARNDVVLSADRNASSQIDEESNASGKFVWGVSSKGDPSPEGELIAFSAGTGRRLWASPCREPYTTPVDVFVSGGLAWWGSLMTIKEPGITEGRDLLTGNVGRTISRDLTTYTPGMGHHRCYRDKATDRYLLLGRAGVEFIDLATGKVVPNHWVRGVCQYGVLPCNGLLYTPPHSCACFIEAKLNGFNALAPAGTKPAHSPQSGGRLERGPAFGKVKNPEPKNKNLEDWPTYRHDAARTGRASGAVPAMLKPAWQTEIGGHLCSPVLADGKIFIADIDAQTVHALDAATGKQAWNYIAGGRVNSPPTIYNGLALFGCADGWVYCLRASDGELVWRFRAAPEDQRLVAYGQVESVWPVPGSVLVEDGLLYFTAGRSSFLDGGMYFYQLDPMTGEVRAQRNIDSRDAKTGGEPQDIIKGVTMPGALPDVMSSDGSFVYMRQMRFNFNGEEQPPDVTHLFSPAGFLDDSWWHRTYWIFGTRMNTGWGGWLTVGRKVPAGRLLVVDDSTVYGFGRLNQYALHGSHVGLEGDELPWPLPTAASPNAPTQYRLFACAKDPKVIMISTGENKPAGSAKNSKAGKKAGHKDEKTAVETRWSKPVGLWARAMVLAGKTLFIAGPPDVFASKEGDVAAFEGKKGGLLLATATADGKALAQYTLESPPVFDGLIAANGRLYMATLNGRVVCWHSGEQKVD